MNLNAASREPGLQQVQVTFRLSLFQGGVHGEEQTSAGAAERTEDRDRKSEDEREGVSTGHHSQPEHRAGDQQTQQLQEGMASG